MANNKEIYGALIGDLEKKEAAVCASLKSAQLRAVRDARPEECDASVALLKDGCEARRQEAAAFGGRLLQLQRTAYGSLAPTAHLAVVCIVRHPDRTEMAWSVDPTSNQVRLTSLKQNPPTRFLLLRDAGRVAGADRGRIAIADPTNPARGVGRIANANAPLMANEPILNTSKGAWGLVPARRTPLSGDPDPDPLVGTTFHIGNDSVQPMEPQWVGCSLPDPLVRMVADPRDRVAWRIEPVGGLPVPPALIRTDYPA